jgi:putative hemolysin
LGWEVFVLVILIAAHGLFAMSEIALVSSRKTRLQRMADEGKHKARAALDLASRPTKFLSTIQTGMTLIGVMAGAFGGVTLSQPLARLLDRVPSLHPYSHPLALGAVVLAITYFSIIFGELVPKRLALAHPERIACAVAKPVGVLSTIIGPAAALLSHSTDGILRIIGLRPSQEPPVTEEELRILIDQGTRAGVFEESEQDMLEGVLRLKDRCAGDLITPRGQIVWLDHDASPSETLAHLRGSPFAAFPVCRGRLDEVVGVVHSKDLLALCLQGQNPDPKRAMSPPLLVPENCKVLDLLKTFRETGQHLAIVLDEYGGVSGLVTVNDIAVSVVGALPAPGETREPMSVQREDGSWLLDGMLPTDEMRDLLRIPKAALQDGSYRTVGGLVMAELGKVPTAGDHFTWSGLRVEVVDMDGKRVDKVLVQDLRGRGTMDTPPAEG